MERAPAAEASHGRSGELPARPVDGTECVLFRRRGAGGQQRVGTGDEARGAEPQELALRGQPARRKNRGDSGQPGLDLPPPRSRSATLLHATAPEPAAAARRPAPHEITRTAWPSRRLAPRPVETGASCPIHRSGNPRSSHHALAPALHVSLTLLPMASRFGKPPSTPPTLASPPPTATAARSPPGRSRTSIRPPLRSPIRQPTFRAGPSWPPMPCPMRPPRSPLARTISLSTRRWSSAKTAPPSPPTAPTSPPSNSPPAPLTGTTKRLRRPPYRLWVRQRATASRPKLQPKARIRFCELIQAVRRHQTLGRQVPSSFFSATFG